MSPLNPLFLFSIEQQNVQFPIGYIDVFKGRALRNILVKHYTPQRTKLPQEMYEKANLAVLE